MMLLSFLSLLPLVYGCVTPPATPSAFSTFTDNTVFVPSSDYTSWRTIYGRSLQLHDGSLIMTWEDYPPEPPLVSFPIYRSTNGGATWASYSEVNDTVNGWGMRYQPFLYMLPEAIGGYPAGTVLIAGVSTAANLSEAYIDLYASTDQAVSWTFVSHIVYGTGPETVTNGNKAIWEPFFVYYGGELICFFSDQRDSDHAQKLARASTSDLKTWSASVDVVSYSTYADRPGMATVAHINTTDQYILTYEYCGSENCAAYYRVAASPLDFDSATGTRIVSNDTSETVPVGSPYVLWTQDGSGKGMIIMNAASSGDLFVNDDTASPTGWRMVDVNQWSAYSRQLQVIDDNGKSRLFIANGGNMVTPSTCNWVVCGVVDLDSI